MAYTPTIWSENDIITAEKLNNIEKGIGNLRDFYDIGELTAIDFPAYTSKVMLEKELTEEQFLEIKEKKAIKGFIKVNNPPFSDSSTIDIPFESSTFITGIAEDLGEFINFSFYIKHSVFFGEISISLMIVSDTSKSSYDLLGVCLLDYNSIIQLQEGGTSTDPLVKGYAINLEEDSYFIDDPFIVRNKIEISIADFKRLIDSPEGITLVLNTPTNVKEYFYLEKNVQYYYYNYANPLEDPENRHPILHYSCFTSRYQMYGSYYPIALLCEITGYPDRTDIKTATVNIYGRNLAYWGSNEIKGGIDTMEETLTDFRTRITALEEAVGITESTNSIT